MRQEPKPENPSRHYAAPSAGLGSGRQLPNALSRIKSAGEPRSSEIIQNGQYLAAAEASRGRKLLFRPRPLGALFGQLTEGDLSIRMDPGVFRIRDQPVDRPPLDLIGRPQSLIFRAVSRAGARTR